MGRVDQKSKKLKSLFPSKKPFKKINKKKDLEIKRSNRTPWQLSPEMLYHTEDTSREAKFRIAKEMPWLLTREVRPIFLIFFEEFQSPLRCYRENLQEIEAETYYKVFRILSREELFESDEREAGG